MRVCDKCGKPAYTHVIVERDDTHLDVCDAHYAELMAWISDITTPWGPVQISPPEEPAARTPPARPRRGRPPTTAKR